MSVSLAKPVPSLRHQHLVAQTVQEIVQQDCSFYLPTVLPMPDGSESYLLFDACRVTETARYRHQVTGEIVTFGWLDCTAV